MNKDEIIHLLLVNRWFTKKQFVYELFTITTDYTFFIYKDKRLYILDDNQEKLIAFYKEGKPLFEMYDMVRVKANDLLCLDKDVEVSIGRLLTNYILLELPLKGKVKFINSKINLGKLTNQTILNMLKDSQISIDEYLDVSIHITYIRAFSRLFVTSDTLKTMIPPPNIDILREKKIKELKAKYGEDALTDYKVLVELSDYLAAIDNEWLKDDPTTGLIMSGKVKRSRVKKHLIYGDEQGLNENNPHAFTIEQPLSKGYDLNNPAEIAAKFNSIRAGSYARGNEIKLAGVVNNVLTRAMGIYHVTDTPDCGNGKYKLVLVTENNLSFLLERTTLGKPIIGKIVKLRSPQHCLEDGYGLCQACVSKMLREIKNGIILFTIDIGGNLSNSFMQKMHGSSVSLIKLEIKDL